MRLSIQAAASLLDQGVVVAVPTETVYGLAASIKHMSAIREIFRIKGRPQDNPLIVHAASSDEVEKMAKEVPEGFKTLADVFWPGPLTLVLPADLGSVPEVARAGLPTAGFRVPSHPITRELLKLTGPLVMPSANLSGRPSATSAGHVEADFGSEFPLLDGGQCHQGVESTILYWSNGRWSVIRLGAIPVEAIAEILGYVPEVVGGERGKGEKPLCPGQMYRHYAPKAVLHLSKVFSDGMQGIVLGYDERRYPEGCQVYSLGSLSAPQTVAGRLYSLLRQLDDDGIKEAWVDVDVEHAGLWRTILERLNKASQ